MPDEIKPTETQETPPPNTETKTQAETLYPEGQKPPEVKPEEKPAEKKEGEAPKEFVPDPNKTPEENAAAKEAFDKANKPAEKDVPVPLDKAAVKMPEGFEVDEPTLDKFLGIMNDPNLTPAARAQQLIDLQAEFVKGASEKGSQLFTKQQEDWQAEIRADKDFGGAKLEENLGAISQLIDVHGTPELRQVFDITGAGNNPHMIRFLTKIAKLNSEGKPLVGTPGPAGPQSQAAKLFPSMKE